MISLFSYFKSAPPFEIWESHPGIPSRILITAGVDGDEYAGIKAAQAMINAYHGTIPLTIIPIVNLAGYHAKMSQNPLDGRYPKHIYPGSPLGSSSSRLRHQLSQYTKGIELWIDLHGGASDEHLKPFIWASEAYPFLSYLSGRILVENSIKKNVPYVILESGELGQIKPSAINLHLSWITSILSNLGKPTKPGWQPTYTQVKYGTFTDQTIVKNLLWHSKKICAFGYN